MVTIFDHLDYFFEPYITPQERRLQFVARNGVAHASAITPSDPEPGEPVMLAIITDAALPIDSVAVYYTTDGGEPRGAQGVAESGAVALARVTQDADSGELVGERHVRYWRAPLPGQPDGTLVRYRIDAWNSGDASQRWLADAKDPSATPAPDGREFAFHVDRRTAPDWVQDAIIYHIFVDRFAAAHDQAPLQATGRITDFYGGTIRGITEKLDYLADLGVNCLWLSPVMESPTYHSYNPSSYYKVSRRFGSNDDLRELIAACHERSMRILLDFVANHTSNEHPAFLAAQQARASAVAGWYTFGADYSNGYLTYYDVKSMPVLNTDMPVVRDYLCAAARYWLTGFGADGLRLDNVSGPTQGFWTLFQESVKDAAPNALTLSEVSGDLTDIRAHAGRADASIDFPLTKAMRRVFALRDAPLSELLDILEEHRTAFPVRMTPARILDNHDMTRFLWLAENDTRRLKLALTFLMSLSGVPIVYYGTEVGLSQREGPPRQDAYAREPMPWGNGQQADVLAQARWLITQRRQRISLRRGQMARVGLANLGNLVGDVADDATADQANQIGALARWHGDEATIIVFNNGDLATQFAIDPLALPFSLRPGATAQGYLLTPDDITPLAEPTSGRLASELPPLSAAMLFLGSDGERA